MRHVLPQTASLHRWLSRRWTPGPSALLLLMAIAAGIGAALSAQRYLQQRAQQVEESQRVPMVERIVAGQDLPQGMRLDPSLLALRAFPATLVPSDSLAAAQAIHLTGMVLRSPLRAGDMVLPAHAQPMARGGFSSRLAQGRRAITMSVDVINAVSGLLQPGDLIDLYVSFEHQRRRVTAPLLQGVLVLATGTNTDDQAGPAAQGYATVTLDTSPEDAVKLVAARQGGSITAMLRSAHDGQVSQTGVRGDLAGLLGLHAPPAPRPARAAVLYGNRALRNPPALQGAVPRAGSPSGLFALPRAEGLVSAWAQAHDAGRDLDASDAAGILHGQEDVEAIPDAPAGISAILLQAQAQAQAQGVDGAGGMP